MTTPPDLPAAIEHVANAIYDVLIPALITWIFWHVRRQWNDWRDRRH